MADICDWCGKPIMDSTEKYNGMWHYQSVYLDGNYICTDCCDKYHKIIDDFSANLRNNKGKLLD